MPCKLLDGLERKLNCEEHHSRDTRAQICLLAGLSPYIGVIESRVFLLYHSKMDGWIIRLLIFSIQSLHTVIYLYKKGNYCQGHIFIWKLWGVLLSDTAQDTKNHIFSIVFYVLDKENDAFWTFFFEKLKSIVENETDICVISISTLVSPMLLLVYSIVHITDFASGTSLKIFVQINTMENIFISYTS